MNYTHFEHPDFTIDVPADWLNIPSPNFEAVFVMPPFPEGPGINLAVAIIRTTVVTSFDEVAENLRAVQRDQYPEYQLHDESVVDFPKRAGFAQYYSWVNPETHLAIAQSQIIFITNSGLLVAVLTCTRPAAMQKPDIKLLDDVFYDMAASFDFTDEG